MNEITKNNILFLFPLLISILTIITGIFLFVNNDRNTLNTSIILFIIGGISIFYLLIYIIIKRYDIFTHLFSNKKIISRISINRNIDESDTDSYLDMKLYSIDNESDDIIFDITCNKNITIKDTIITI